MKPQLETTYETTAFIDIMKLCVNGKVPKEIPAHYWRFCWSLRRNSMGNKVPNVDLQSIFTRSKPIKLWYTQ